MDLLVELIVWIFKSLAGVDDKKKPPGAGGRPPGPTVRGPYDYGDGRQTGQGGMQSGGPRPKTLEEILQEVRRQQQARAQGQVPQQPVVPQSVQRQGEKPKLSKAERKALIAKARAERQAQGAPNPMATMPQDYPEPVHQATVDRHLESSFEKREMASALAEREVLRQQKIESKFDAVKNREEQRFKPLSVEQEEVEAVNSIAANARIARAEDKVQQDFFKLLRGGKPEVRREMARQALILIEVFGPPKCKRRAGPKYNVGSKS